MSTMRCCKLLMTLTVALGLLVTNTIVASPADDARPKADQSITATPHAATWAPVDAVQVETQARAWLAEQDATTPGTTEAMAAKAAAIWRDGNTTQDATVQDNMLRGNMPRGDVLLRQLTETFALANADATRLVQLCSERRTLAGVTAEPWLTNAKTPPLVANNMRLLYGRWLVHEQLFDEAALQLRGLEPADVVAPASLLFYQAATSHVLLDREKGLEAIEQLLAGADQSPQRYIVLAKLMQHDLKQLEDDTLDHIARRMANIRRHLDLGRADAKVRDIEQGVIESLDKLIAKAEEKQKQQQSGGSGAGGNQSNAPASDSQLLGGRGRGDVVKRDIGSQDGWGNLPPKQREEALQQIGRDFPPHYRDVIEQYFRRLAGDERP